jgi:hypothetical protein
MSTTIHTDNAQAVLNQLASGSFYDTTTQTTGVATAKAMRFNTIDFATTNGVTILNDSFGAPTRITVSQNGVYNIAFSAQLHKTSGGGATQIYIWFRIDGTDIPDSNTTLTLANNGDLLVAAWNFFTKMNAGNSVEIMWQASAASVELLRNTTVSPLPAIPSVIATINRVR